MKQETFDVIVKETIENMGALNYKTIEAGIGLNIGDNTVDLIESKDGFSNITFLLQVERELTQDTIPTQTLLENRIKSIQSVLLTKGKEYGSVDRLHNFRVAAARSGIVMVGIGKFFQLKHLISIEDMLTSQLEATPEAINEKIGDAINYEILMIAIRAEEE